MTLRFSSHLLGPILVGTPSRARQDHPAASDPAFEQIAALVTQKMAEYGVPGVAFGMLKDGRSTVRGFRRHQRRQPAADDARDDVSARVDLEDGHGDGDHAAGRTGQDRSRGAGPAYLPDFAVADGGDTRVAIWHLLTHTPGWEGQLTPEDRGVHSLAPLCRIAAAAAAAGPAGRGLELQQRRLHDRRPRDRSGSGQPIHDALRDLVFSRSASRARSRGPKRPSRTASPPRIGRPTARRSSGRSADRAR